MAMTRKPCWPSDLTHDTTVVIKTAAAASFSASVRMRLEHEAHVLSQVKNGLFAPLLDFGSEGDQVYLVMPFIPGITLQARLRQGPLSVMEAITLGRALLTALSAAHAHDVLHRDVKPANVIVNEGTPLREATLIDFGLARTANLDASIRDQWVGTAQYLSPEGAGLLDQEVTACSDLYSAGIVLFECLCRSAPVSGKKRRRSLAPAHDGASLPNCAAWVCRCRVCWMKSSSDCCARIHATVTKRPRPWSPT